MAGPRTFPSWRRIAPTMVTLAALFFGFASILASMESVRRGDLSLIPRAAQNVILALILDGLDGNLARWLHGSTAFGAELDTFVDITAFGIAPAVLLYTLMYYGGSPFWGTALPALVIFSGALRMSKFRIVDPLRGQGGFIGLPITVNATWITMGAFADQIFYPNRPVLISGLPGVFFLGMMVVMLVLQLSNLRYPKPSNKVKFFAPAALVVVLLWFLSEVYAAVIAGLIVIVCFFYVLLGPAIHRRTTARRAFPVGSHHHEGHGN